MDTDEIKKFIILELGKHHSPDGIVKEVCERTGMGWSDAQNLVRQVYSQNRSEIAGHQNGILSILAVLEIIAGIALTVGIFVATLSGWIIFFLRLPIPYLGNLFYMVIGIALIFGGIRGITNMRSKNK